MNKREAKQLINEQKNSLNNLSEIETIQNQWWLDKTHMYITAIFGGPDKSLAIPMYQTYYDVNKNTIDPINSKAKINDLFDTYLIIIDNNIYHKRNVFSDSNNTTIISVLIFVVGLLGSWSFVEGVRSANINYKDQVKRIEKLSDSISTINQLEQKYKSYYDSTKTEQKPPITFKRNEKHNRGR